MGVASEFIRNLDPSKEAEAELKETLTILTKLAQQKLELYKIEMNKSWETVDEESLAPGVTKDYQDEQMRVITSTDGAALGNSVGDIVDAVFSLGNGLNEKSVGNFIKTLATQGLNTLLGSGTAEENEHKQYIIYPDGNFLCRCDVWSWRYSITSKGFQEKIQHLVVFRMQYGAVDINKVTPLALAHWYDKWHLSTEDAKKVIEQAKTLVEANRPSNNLKSIMQIRTAKEIKKDREVYMAARTKGSNKLLKETGRSKNLREGRHKKILILLPFSGSQFTGGLAAANEQLTRSLANPEADVDVKLAILQLPDQFMPREGRHGAAELITINNDNWELNNFVNNDPWRDRLYNIFNNHDEVFIQLINYCTNHKWFPDYIIGHSRFSGRCAVQLKQLLINQRNEPGSTSPTVGYFLHSYPLGEGDIVRESLEITEENQDRLLTKMNLERIWMEESDVVLTMGPLLRWGAEYILAGSQRRNKIMVHEVISGIDLKKAEIDPHPEYMPPYKVGDLSEWRLLLVGRADAPIKGFQDIVLAAIELSQNLPCYIDIRVIGVSREQLDIINQWLADVGIYEYGDGKRVKVQVIELIREPARLEEEYRRAHLVISAAYFEHFGLVPFEALSIGRPVLISELSGMGQFLRRLYLEENPGLGGILDVGVVPDISPALAQGNTIADILNPDLVQRAQVMPGGDLFQFRPEVWSEAIFHVCENHRHFWESSMNLRRFLMENYNEQHFARSILNALNHHELASSHEGIALRLLTRQVPGGHIEDLRQPRD